MYPAYWVAYLSVTALDLVRSISRILAKNDSYHQVQPANTANVPGICLTTANSYQTIGGSVAFPLFENNQLGRPLMNCKNLISITLPFLFVSPALAQPALSVIPQGIQAGNWVGEIDITPDLVLAGGSTTLAVELGFRLSGDPLINVTNINPTQFDLSNPGKKIFGWEIPYPQDNNNPEGIEVNCTGCTVVNAAVGAHPFTIVLGSTNEIFSAIGSVSFTTPGPKPFLQIIAQGSGSGGPPGSTIEWLGAYNGKGRIAQACTGGPGCIGGVANYDLYSGTASQGVPEPASAVLAGATAVVFAAATRRRRR